MDEIEVGEGCEMIPGVFQAISCEKIPKISKNHFFFSEK